MENLPPKSIRSQVYNYIFRDIINGVFPMDEYLTEKVLIEKYGVSRAPIREALMQLRSDGLITAVPRHGYRIRKPSQHELLDNVQFRCVLECTFLQQYHQRITPEDVRRLRQRCMDTEKGIADGSEFLILWKSNAVFHVQLFALYGNELALQSLINALDRQSVYFVERMQHRDVSSGLHYAILDYLEKGDIEMANTLLRVDIEKIPTADDVVQQAKEKSVLEHTRYGFSNP